MSGNFWPLFRNTLIGSAIMFLIIWAFSYFIIGWSPGEAFIQLTNPIRHDKGESAVSALEWLPITVTNLFGLFVLNGVVLTLLVNWVSNRKDRHEKGKARYEYIFSKKFSVIIGGHKIAAGLSRDLISKGKNEYLLIQTQRNAEIVRKEIYAEIKDERLARNVIT